MEYKIQNIGEDQGISHTQDTKCRSKWFLLHMDGDTTGNWKASG